MSAPASRTSVLMVTRFAPPDYSGAGLQALRLASRLQESGTDVTILAGTSRSRWPRRETVGGVKVHRVPALGGPRRRRACMSAGLALHLLAHPRRYPVVHLHGSIYLLAALRALKRVMKFALVYKPTMVGKDDASAVAARYGGSTLAAVDRWICIVDAIADNAVGAGVTEDRLLRISNGVDMRRFRPLDPRQRTSVRRELGVSEDERLWITVGALVPRKRPDLLIKSLALAGLPADRLLIVGPAEYDQDAGAVSARDNAYHAELERLIRERSLGARVTLVGGRDDVARLMGAADGFLFASEQEGMPNAVLEALAAGLPVLSVPMAASKDLTLMSEGRVRLAAADADVFARAMASFDLGPGSVPLGLRRHELGEVAARYTMLYAALAGSRSIRDSWAWSWR
jgi:glycosyltransferase involved in cell wall biosynthesis